MAAFLAAWCLFDNPRIMEQASEEAKQAELIDFLRGTLWPSI